MCELTPEHVLAELAEIAFAVPGEEGGLPVKTADKLRALERKVRKYKRRYLAESEAGLDAGGTAARLKAARQQLAEFIRDTGGRPDSARTSVQGFGRSAGSKAAWAAKRLQGAPSHAILEETSSFGYKEITMQSIQRIQPFACETLDTAGSRALANAHKKLLLEARKVPLGIEKARCYGLDMQPLSGYIESPKSGESVRITVPTQACIIMHNHPSGLTFSPKDLLSFAKNPSIKMLTAVGNDGSVYAIERTSHTNEVALYFNALKLNEATKKVETNAQVWNLMNTFFKEVQQYGVQYYT